MMDPEEDRLCEEWDALYEALETDVLRFERLIETQDCGAWRRSYCRALFALIEGMANWMKRFTIHCYYPGMLSEDEKKELENRRGVLLGLFHALDLHADTSGAETPLIKNSNEWFALQGAIRIRNRVTHPECPSDVNISDVDLSHLRATKRMFLALTSRCFLDSALALGRQADMLQGNWDRGNES